MAGCASGGRLEKPPAAFQSEPWQFGNAPGRKLTTAHYEIYTTLKDPVLLDALPDFVEAAFEEYQRLVPPARQAEERMKVFLFVSRDQWVAFTRRFTGPRAGVFLQVRNGGYSERGVSVIEYVRHEITFPLFSHEGFHQYLHHYVHENVPAWLNEGLAVACEGQRWGSWKGRFGLKQFDPWFNPSRRNALASAVLEKKLLPLRTLLETHAGEVIKGTSQSVATYYAEVWALTLFLQEGAGGKYAPGFRRLLDKLRDADLDQYARAAHIWSDGERFNPGEALFRSFISDDIDTVEREYLAFLRERLF